MIISIQDFRFSKKRMNNQKLVNLGNVTIDDVVKYDGTTNMGCLGGDVIYASAAARLFIDDVNMIAPIGFDYPKENLALLSELGMNISGLTVRDVPTHRNWVIYENDGRRFWVNRTDENNFYKLSPVYEDIPQNMLNADGYLILAMDLLAQENLVNGLRKSNSFIVLDPQEDYILGNEERLMKMIGMVDVFMPSEIEVFRLCGHKDFDRAAEQFHSHGCKKVVIKLGSDGCCLYDAESKTKMKIPCFNTNAVDTTGAGDSFCGGFISAFIKTRDMKEAAIAGTIAASFAVEGFGAQSLIQTTRTQVELRTKKYLSEYNLGV